MNGVVRIALTYFTFVPLQRWLNGVAVVLFAFGGIALFVDDPHSTANAGFLFMLVGASIAAITPGFGGGVALRFGSTRSVLHLRPQGRLRVLLGSTLAITLLAGLIALPFLLVSWDGAAIRDGVVRHATPALVFQVGWAAIAVTWMAMFAMSRSMLAFALLGLLPAIGMHLFRFLVPLVPSPVWILAFGALAWSLFGAWYLRTDYIARPNLPALSMSTTGIEGSALYRLLLRVGGSAGARTRAQAAYEYLFGCSSPLFFVFVGVWVAVIFLVVIFIGPGNRTRGPNPSLMMLPFFSFFHASLGFTTARRGRFLWLRTGMDRAALFRKAELWGQGSAFSAWIVTAAVVLIYSASRQATLSIDTLLFVAVQAMMAGALFYAGLGSVRGWTLDELVVGLLVAVLFAGQVFAFAALRPVPTGMYLAVAAATALAAVLLRWRAAYVWRALDWRVAKVSRFAMGC